MDSTLNDSRAGNSGSDGRQSLRETSVIDVIVPDGQHGAVGSSMTRHSNEMSGGPVDFSGMSNREPDGYGQPAVPSSTTRDRSQSAPEVPTVAVASVASPGIAAFLAASLIVSMTAVRTAPMADPSRPSFLHGIIPRPENPAEWNEVVLAHIRTMTFVISSTADLHFATAMLAANTLPWVFHHITSVVFPQLYWFSGTSLDRPNDPYFMFARELPLLNQLSFTLHTAGLTTSCFGERQMIALERTNPLRAKERKVKSLQDVVAQYDFGSLFLCANLQRIRIEYIDCEMTAFFTRVGRPVDVLRDIQIFLITGFADRGVEVFVELVKVDG